MELIDLVDENNQLTGKAIEKEIAHEKGLWHREIAIWIMNKQGKILLQKRALSKKQHPGKWSLTAGHITAGEKQIDAAIREAEEELGIQVIKEQLEEICCVETKDKHPESNTLNYCYTYQYFLEVNKKIEEYEIQKEELSEVRYYSLEDLEKIVEEKNQEYTFSRRSYMPKVIEILKKKREELKK